MLSKRGKCKNPRVARLAIQGLDENRQLAPAKTRFRLVFGLACILSILTKEMEVIL